MKYLPEILVLLATFALVILTISSYYFGVWDIAGFKAHALVHMNLTSLILLPIISVIYGVYELKSEVE